MVFDTLNHLQLHIFRKTIHINKLISNGLNIIVLTAALSVYNSCVYSNSRMLYGLAEQGNAPKLLMKLNKNHVPVLGILVSAIFAVLCVLINVMIPENALNIFMSLVVSSLIINWIMIRLTHIFFKKQKLKQGIKTKFPTLLYPLTNYLSLFFLGGVLVMMWFTGLKLSVELIPIWLAVLYLAYYVLYKVKKKKEA